MGGSGWRSPRLSVLWNASRASVCDQEGQGVKSARRLCRSVGGQVAAAHRRLGGLVESAVLAERQGRRAAVEREAEDLVHGLHQVELEHVTHLGRYLLEVLLVLLGQDDLGDLGAVGGEDLVFDAA